MWGRSGSHGNCGYCGVEVVAMATGGHSGVEVVAMVIGYCRVVAVAMVTVVTVG